MFQKNLEKRKTFQGFTLAEVLITLAVIGVVAAITMPVLMSNINERINSERHANIAYKITQAMEQMRAHGKLIQYASTDAFVDELQKYLKIQKRCSASNIAECWPTETVTTSSGEEYNVADCQKRKNLLAGSDSNDNNVGLILADGASIILTYNPETQGKDIGDEILSDNDHQLPVGNGKFRSFVYTTGVTGAIDFVTDVNGKKGPNSEKANGKWNDIRSFKIASFNETGPEPECGDAGCILYAAGYGAHDPVDCRLSNSSSSDYQNYCGSTPSGVEDDLWAGARKLCAEANMNLPTMQELRTIRQNKSQYPSIPPETHWFWSIDTTYENRVVVIDFSDGDEGTTIKSYVNNGVLCKSD